MRVLDIYGYIVGKYDKQVEVEIPNCKGMYDGEKIVRKLVLRGIMVKKKKKKLVAEVR